MGGRLLQKMEQMTCKRDKSSTNDTPGFSISVIFGMLSLAERPN